MKELNTFRKFLAEGQINENLGAKLAGKMEVELTMMNPGEDDYEITKNYIPKFKAAKSDEDAKVILNQFSKEMGQASGTFAGDITAAYLEENIEEGEEVNEQITPDELRKEFYKGMQIMDSALAKAKGTISQEQWNALYAVVSKVEDMAEFIGDEEGFEGYGSTGF